MATTHQVVAESALATAIDALEVMADALASTPEVHILKAIKGNDRFKNSSAWVSLPSGNYKHIQSGKITKPERLVGYTEVAYTL